jgi:hypothetical protein
MRALVLLFLCACGGQASSPDLAEPADLAPAIDLAPMHPAAPVIANQGGPVMTSLEQWVIVWQGDEPRGQEAVSFLSWLLASDFWTSSLAEYGVGVGSSKGLLVVPMPPPATFDVTSIDSIISSVTASAGVTIGSQSAFAILVPPSTTLTELGTSFSCMQLTSFHDESPNRIPYEMIMNCTVRTLQHELTHEVSEVATDPFPQTAPAWTDPDYGLEPELADMCAQLADVEVFDPKSESRRATVGYLVPRMYSNAAAMTGLEDPCVPAQVPYFGVATDPVVIPVPVDASGTGTATISLVPFSYGDAAALSWSAHALDPGVTVTPSNGMLTPGTPTSVTVNTTSAVHSGSVLYIRATDENGNKNVWTSALRLQ